MCPFPDFIRLFVPVDAFRRFGGGKKNCLKKVEKWQQIYGTSSIQIITVSNNSGKPEFWRFGPEF